MEDTGWYKARMEMAQPLNWGRNLGCQFAQRSCMEWMETKAAKYAFVILLLFLALLSRAIFAKNLLLLQK